MKTGFSIVSFVYLTAAGSFAEEALPKEEALAKHRGSAEQLAADQDELSADVQQLVIEQTVPQVIELLKEVEDIMDETTDRLDGADTGGETIAAQTEIIEKIHAAAKERQSQSGSGKAGGAMMDMMERMMGKEPQDGKAGKDGDQPGDQAGQGMTGDSDTANEGVDGTAGGSAAERTVPKASGTAGAEMPEEFRKAFDAYNRAVEEKLK